MSYCLIDNRHCGIGDLLVHIWCAHSAREASAAVVRLNPRSHTELAATFGMQPHELAEEAGADTGGASLGGPPGSGLEERLAHGRRQLSRFDAWCEHFSLPRLMPRRPPYRERRDLAPWATATWRRLEDSTRSGPRILLFPLSKGGGLRDWPRRSWLELARLLDEDGACVVADLPWSDARFDGFPRALTGLPLLHLIALMARADLVVANDSGPAHLGATLGVPTVAICGSTRPEIVFEHAADVVTGITVDRELVPCVGCHFRADRGFESACTGGCRALAQLRPDVVRDRLWSQLAAAIG